jgi:hypothetical protein
MVFRRRVIHSVHYDVHNNRNLKEEEEEEGTTTNEITTGTAVLATKHEKTN